MAYRDKRPSGLLTLDDIYQACLSDLIPYLTHEDIVVVNQLRPNVEGMSKLSQLCSLAVLQGAEVQRIAALRQLEALFKKNVSLSGTSGKDRKGEALSLFLASEVRCKEVNKEISNPTWLASLNLAVKDVITQAKWIIYNTLGEVPDADSLWKGCAFGPGQTFGSNSMEYANLYFKIAGPHTMTAECARFLSESPSFAAYFPFWVSTLISENVSYDIVRGNRVTTVSKTAVTDRTIAIEPSMNVFIQKGIERLMSKRLRRIGVDLASQGRNRHLARIGSMNGIYSTVDLSSASDTISCGVVEAMLPKSWYVLLDTFRSAEYTLDKGKTWSTYEKFSSMGNAFTFPLETLIFHSVAQACSIVCGLDESECSTYGDDIIVKQECYPLLVETLSSLGFTVNLEKSYSHGPFRESCGSDYYNGRDIRPVYLKKTPNQPWELCNFFNRLLHNRFGFRFDRTLTLLLKVDKSPLFGPAYLPTGQDYENWYAGKSIEFDGYFHAPIHMVERFQKWNDILQRNEYQALAWRVKPKKLRHDFSKCFQYLLFLYIGSSDDTNSKIHQKWVMRRVTWSHFPNLPWWPSCYDCVE